MLEKSTIQKNKLEVSYLLRSVLLSTYGLQPARCTGPHPLAPPAGWLVYDSSLHCWSQSAPTAGWHCCLCTSGCYTWGWRRHSPGSRGSSPEQFYPGEVLQCWQEALERKKLKQIHGNNIEKYLVNSILYDKLSKWNFTCFIKVQKSNTFYF